MPSRARTRPERRRRRDRKGVVEGKRGDLGGRRIIKKKTDEGPADEGEAPDRGELPVGDRHEGVTPVSDQPPGAVRPRVGVQCPLGLFVFFFKQKTAYEILR